VLCRKINQLQSAFPKNPPTACYLFTLQLVDFLIKHFAVGGFYESALRS